MWWRRKPGSPAFPKHGLQDGLIQLLASTACGVWGTLPMDKNDVSKEKSNQPNPKATIWSLSSLHCSPKAVNATAQGARGESPASRQAPHPGAAGSGCGCRARGWAALVMGGGRGTQRRGGKPGAAVSIRCSLLGSIEPSNILPR